MGDPVEFDFTDFVCTCDDERRAAAAALRAEVRQRVAAESEELMARAVDADNFVTELVRSLAWDFKAQITRLGADQWFGVWAEADDGSFKTFVQCDALEDGLAATWKAFAERAGSQATTD